MPGKRKQNDNPNAVCGFCIAKQKKNLIYNLRIKK